MQIRSRGFAALLAAGLLAACGGGETTAPGTTPTAGAPTTKGSFTALVSFGDSLSDQGAYAPATSLTANGQPPYFGGKFTVNVDGNGGKVWVENLATTLGLAVQPAEVGFAGSAVKCPAKQVNPAFAAICTSYGQGGARVTSPDGIGRATGALTVPLVTQVDNHLAAFGSFKASDLVIVWGGNNDVFVQFGIFGAKAAAIAAEALAGRISADEARRQQFLAQTEAQAALKQAAQELSALVKDKILAQGGRYVAVFNLPDSSASPFGSSLSADARGVLSALVDTFNLWLRDGLAGQPVQLVDQNSFFKTVAANPAAYGLTESALPACDAAKIAAITGNQVTDGSSLFCNGTPGAPYNGLRTGADLNTWQFADGVHPTPGAHKVISDQVTTQLRSFGWI